MSFLPKVKIDSYKNLANTKKGDNYRFTVSHNASISISMGQESRKLNEQGKVEHVKSLYRRALIQPCFFFEFLVWER